MIIYPNNKTLEENIVGCLICNDKAQYNIKLLKEEYFYNDASKVLFKILQFMDEKKKEINPISVSDYSIKKGIQLEYIIEISKYFHLVNIKQEIEKLIEHYERRMYILASKEIEVEALQMDFESRIDMKTNMLNKLNKIYSETSSKDEFKVENILTNTLNMIEDNYNNNTQHKFLYGIGDLDRITAGTHKGEMTVVGARPGVGKTSFSLQVALNLAMKKNTVMIFTKEMKKEALMSRLICNVAGINGQKLREARALNDEDWKKIHEATSIIGNTEIIINDSCKYVEEILSFVAELSLEKNIDYVIVDYIQLFKTLKKTQSREREVAECSVMLKEATLQYDIPIMVLAQLNRASEINKRAPCKADLRESGTLEQDADNIFFLHEPETEEEQGKNKSSKIDLIVDKQRNGPTMVVQMTNYKNNGRWYGVKM